jgi:hypothetical protein
MQSKVAALLYQRRTGLAIFVLLAVIHTWPLASDPVHLTRVDNADYLLNSWAISWVAHQLPRNPVHLFDANIFYPEPLTLAYSESMIVQGILALPIRALGGTPVLAYNLVLIAGFALTSWAFWLLIRNWTGNISAAYIGGSLAGFNAAVLVRLPHLQAQHLEFVPLMLFALDRLLDRRQTRDALWLALGYALQGLTSIYLLVFSMWMLLFAVLGRAGEWMRRHAVKTAAQLALAGTVAVLLLSPYLWTYYRLHRMTGFERSVADARQFAASWNDYLSTGARVHFELWSHTFYGRAVSASFPGIIGAALAALALVWPDTRRNPRVHMCLGAAIGCAAVSFVPRAPFYPALHPLIPMFRAVRVGAHLGQFVVMMLAVLAGLGVAGLATRWKNPRTWRFVAVALFILVNLEALRAPLGYRHFDGIPKIYDELARLPDRVVIVAEIPLWPPHTAQGNAGFMFNSTRYWRPMVSGYSGFAPDSYTATFDALQHFPDDASLIGLHERGVTHVVVHKSLLEPERFAAISKISTLQHQNDDGEIYFYKLR